ncbi:hypothetical protein [Streptomyces parvus]
MGLRSPAGPPRRKAIPASAVAQAIGSAVSRPEDIDVSELVVRPTAQT